MPEYPDNSHSARENTSPPSKRVEKVVNGTAKTRKQSEVKKFAGIFMPDEVGDVKTFIITDVVTMTDGSKYNIAVYNGLNGTGTGDVLGIHFDLVLPASGWSNGSITVAESRLVAAAKYKYLIDAYEASREEYLECNVRPKDISTTGFITFVNDTDPIKDITVNIVRLELSVNAEEGGE